MFEIAIDEFSPLLIKRPLARDRGRGWQLDRLAAATDRIAAEVRRRIDEGPLPAAWNWRDAIDRAIDRPMPGGTRERAEEERARAEKTAAVQVLATSRVAALVGPAGTGKTTMLEALCLEPGGERGRRDPARADRQGRVQLGDKVGAEGSDPGAVPTPRIGGAGSTATAWLRDPLSSGAPGRS